MKYECVYFVSDGNARIKIGFTSHLRDRIASLRTASPNIQVLAVIPGAGRDKEKELHRRFAGCRLWGEWFEPDDELRQFVAECVREENRALLRAREIEAKIAKSLSTSEGRSHYLNVYGYDDLRWLLDQVFELSLQQKRFP